MRGGYSFDDSAGRFVLPYEQEPWEPDMPQPRVVKRGWLSDLLQVPLLSGRLTVRHVTAVDGSAEWDDMGILVGVEFDSTTSELRLRSNDVLRLRVDRLDVLAEQSNDVGSYVRRRQGRARPWQLDFDGR